MSDKDKGGGFSAGFVWGGLIGAAAVFLLGTEEGKKIKKQLLNKGQELVDDLPQIVSDLEKQGQEFAEKAEAVKEKLESKAKELSSGTKKEIKETLTNIEKTQERGRRAAADVRKRFFVRKGKKLK